MLGDRCWVLGDVCGVGCEVRGCGGEVCSIVVRVLCSRYDDESCKAQCQCGAQCTVYSVQCTVYSVPYTCVISEKVQNLSNSQRPFLPSSFPLRLRRSSSPSTSSSLFHLSLSVFFFVFFAAQVYSAKLWRRDRHDRLLAVATAAAAGGALRRVRRRGQPREGGRGGGGGWCGRGRGQRRCAAAQRGRRVKDGGSGWLNRCDVYTCIL